MPNPYAPRVTRRTEPEQVGELAGFLHRLRLLGATDEELASVADTWDQLTDEFTVLDRAQMLAWDDEKLGAELAALRAEYRQHTTTEADDATEAAARATNTAQAEAHDVVGRPVASVLEWVGSDVLRAIAILDLEQGPDGAARKTLVVPLRTLVEGEPPAEPEADGTAG